MGFWKKLFGGSAESAVPARTSSEAVTDRGLTEEAAMPVPRGQRTGKTVCDHCEAQVGPGGLNEVTPTEMRAWLLAGFSLPGGPLEDFVHQTMGTDKIRRRKYEANTARIAVADTTSTWYCSRCFALFKSHKVPQNSIVFTDPTRYSGFPLRLLKYLFVHVPEDTIEEARLPADFFRTLCDTAGADPKEVLTQANISYVTGSDAGDAVQNARDLPSWVSEQIDSFYPGAPRDPRYFTHVRTFQSAQPEHHGLLVLIYDLEGE